MKSSKNVVVKLTAWEMEWIARALRVAPNHFVLDQDALEQLASLERRFLYASNVEIKTTERRKAYVAANERHPLPITSKR